MTQTPLQLSRKREELQKWLRFIGVEGNVLREYPQLLFQQAANQPDDSLLATAAKEPLEAGLERRAWLRWLNKPKSQSMCLMTLLAGASEVVLISQMGGESYRLAFTLKSGTA